MKTNPLKKIRVEKGLTVAQAAKILGVHHMSVYFWESWRKVPKRKNLKKIKKEFGIDPTEMMGL
jgi:DNA-binding XRE family transcriptional regulator